MVERFSGKMLKIFLDESQEHHKESMYNFIIDKIKEYDIKGGTVIRGIEGIGQEHKITSEFIEVLSRKLPIVIEIIDEKEKIDKFTEYIINVVPECTIAVIDNIDIIKCNKK